MVWPQNYDPLGHPVISTLLAALPVVVLLGSIGVAGIRPLLDLRGRRDRVGYELHATVIAVADEIAGAAELVMGKTDGVPGAVVRGLDVMGEGTARELLMPADRDLFR